MQFWNSITSLVFWIWWKPIKTLFFINYWQSFSLNKYRLKYCVNKFCSSEHEICVTHYVHRLMASVFFSDDIVCNKPATMSSVVIFSRYHHCKILHHSCSNWCPFKQNNRSPWVIHWTLIDALKNIMSHTITALSHFSLPYNILSQISQNLMFALILISE